MPMRAVGLEESMRSRRKPCVEASRARNFSSTALSASIASTTGAMPCAASSRSGARIGRARPGQAGRAGAHEGQRAEGLGPPQHRGAGDQAAEAVADEVHRALAQVVDDGQQVAGERLDGVGVEVVGARRLVLAALVEQDHRVAGLDERRGDEPEVLLAAGEARHEQDGGARAHLRRRAQDGERSAGHVEEGQLELEVGADRVESHAVQARCARHQARRAACTRYVTPTPDTTQRVAVRNEASDSRSSRRPPTTVPSIDSGHGEQQHEHRQVAGRRRSPP